MRELHNILILLIYLIFRRLLETFIALPRFCVRLGFSVHRQCSLCVSEEICIPTLVALHGASLLGEVLLAFVGASFFWHLTFWLFVN